IAGIIAAVLLIAAFVIFVVPFQYKAIQVYCENSTVAHTEYYVGEEPYTEIEPYNETEPYNGTEHIKYKIIEGKKETPVKKCYKTGLGYSCESGEIGIIQNIDDVSGKFIVRVSVSLGKKSATWDSHFKRIGTFSTSTYFLNPGESHLIEIYYSLPFDKIDNKDEVVYWEIYDVIPSSKHIDKRTIIKYRNVTKYKNVTKTREVTKHYSVKKQREITKNATLFGQWTGKATRYEDIECRVND
ncbi:MAG: hypothetical protein CVT89_02800, partial [Candidatus Altiarchaeales archaeon HGW-Altiarchaeales-2]